MNALTLNLKGERLNALPPEVLVLVAGARAWLAGGGARDVLFGREPKDYDLFFRSAHDMKRADVLLGVDGWGWECAYRCKAGELVTWKRDGTVIQIIGKAFHPDRESLIDTFDLTASLFAVEMEAGRLTVTTTRRAVRDARRKRLALHRLTYPAATMARIARYESKGYSPGSVRSDFVRMVSGRSWSDEELQYYPVD